MKNEEDGDKNLPCFHPWHVLTVGCTRDELIIIRERERERERER